MEMILNVEQLGKRYSVDVGYHDTFKKAKNRYFSNVSPCCESRVRQNKICGECGKEVDRDEITQKLIKIGGEEYIIPKEKIDTIKENIANSEKDMVVKAVLKRDDFEFPLMRVEGVKWTSPANKRTKDYIELRELCKDYVLIAEAVFKSNTYEVAVITIDDKLVIVKFATENRMKSSPNLEGIEDIELKEELINLSKKVLEKKSQKEYDFTEFEDIRQKKTDELIEAVALGGEIPKIEKKEKETTGTDESEMERLKALLKE